MTFLIRYRRFSVSKFLTLTGRGMLGLVLAAGLMTFSLPAGAADQCARIFDLDHAAVLQRIANNKFETARNIFEYQSLLHPGFIHSLKALRSDQHWVDLGAGKAKAQIDFLKSFRDASQAPHNTAVAYKLDRWFRPPHFFGKLEVKEGAFENQDTSHWKKADLATDLFGVLSYTHDFSLSLQKIVDLLQVQGELYIMTTPWRTHFVSQGRSLRLEEFLKEIPGLRIEGEYGTLKVTKLVEKVQVPQLELTEIQDEAPPSRVFQIIE